MPLNRTINNYGGELELFDRTQFIYETQEDQYRCPHGKLLKLRQLNYGRSIYHAAVSDCVNCPLKAQCTKAPSRSVSRHPNEAAFERMEQRMQAHPEKMVERRSIVEHPFGNLKQWIMGTGRFLLKQLKGVRTEMALAVLAHNFKRAINVLGASKMIAKMA